MQALHLHCSHLMSLSQWHIRTQAQTEDHGQLHCHCVLGQDATGLSRLFHSRSVGQCLRLLQSLSQRAHKAMPYGLGQSPPYCPVCRELWRIKFDHLLSRSHLLINKLTLFFPLPVLASKGPTFQTHISDFFWQLGLFSFTFSWQSSGPTCSTSATADEACICRLPTSHAATCQDSQGSKLQLSDNGLSKNAFVSNMVVLVWRKTSLKKMWPQLGLHVSHVKSQIKKEELGR